MKKRLLLLTLFVAAVSSVYGVATIKVTPSDGEFAGQTWSIETDDGKTTTWGNYQHTDISNALQYMVRPGYTFVGFENDYIVNGQALHYVHDHNIPVPYGEIDFSKTEPFSFYGHKEKNGITINLWAYMDNWDDFYEKDMRLVSCQADGSNRGWSIGCAKVSGYDGKICCCFYDRNGKYVILPLKATWKNLPEKTWHMFTLTIGSRYASFYLDGAPISHGGTNYATDDRITGASGGGVWYHDNVNVMVGGNPTTSNTHDNKHKFTGKIRGLCVVHRAFERDTDDGLTKDQTDDIIESWYKNPTKILAVTSTSTSELVILGDKCEWELNSSTKTTLFPDKDIATLPTFSNNENKKEQSAGLHEVVNEPKKLDNLFNHWVSTLGSGTLYISQYQDIDIKPSNPFTRPTAGGSSDIVEFDNTAKTYYYLPKSMKWEDCFTISVWAWMDNWSNFKSSNMRLFSCTESGGWNLEPNSSGLLDFLCRDAKTNAYKRATSLDWTFERLENEGGIPISYDGQEGRWHMFTMTFDGKFLRGYLDGKLIATSDFFEGGKIKYHTGNHIILGAEPGDYTDNTITLTGGYFKGKMRDFCMLHTALAPSQVKLLYDYPEKQHYFFPAHDANLIAAWKRLTDLSADKITADKEFFLGETGTSQAITITGNGVEQPTVSVSKASNWDVSPLTWGTGTNKGSVIVKYTPTEVGEHTITLTVESPLSTTPDPITATYKTYRKFAITQQPEATIHMWKNTVAEQTIEADGDGHTKPTIDIPSTYSNVSKNITVDKLQATFTYKPTEAGKHSETITVRSNSGFSRNEAKEEITLTYHAHEFDVAYWQEDGFLVRADAELAGTTITLTEKDNADNSITFSKDKHTDNSAYSFKITGQTGQTKDLRDLENTVVRARFVGKDGWELEKEIYIPRIVDTDEEATTTGAGVRDNNFDVIVTSGRTLTHQEGTPVINNLYVQSGAKFAIDDESSSKDDTYTTQSVILYSEKDEVPHLILPNGKGTMHIESDSIYFVKRIPYDRYYEICLPFDCNVEDIRIMDGMSMNGRKWADGPSQKGIDWDVVYYDGAKRVRDLDSGDNWQFLAADGVMKAGQGYLVAVDAPSGDIMRELVFPMCVGNGDLSKKDNTDKTVTVTAWGASPKHDDVGANHKGWNFVGNPYFTAYAHAKNALDNIIKPGAVIENQWNPNGLYLSIAERGVGLVTTYTQVLYNDANTVLPPFSAFFIQVGSDTKTEEVKSLVFSPNSKTEADEQSPQGLAPRRANEKKPVYVGVTLSNGTLKDETSLVIGPQFTQAYEIGSDLEKMLGLGVRPQVYVTDANYQYAFKSLQQADAAQPNALGVYLPAQGEYTFAVKESYDLSQVQALYLTDKEKNVTVNLLQTPYTFSGSKTHTKTRFSISTVLSADVATSLSNTAASWAVWQNGELSIRVQGLTVGDAIRIFDSMGRLVGQGVAKDTAADFEVPTTGTYCIQTVGETGSYTKKLLVVGF